MKHTMRSGGKAMKGGTKPRLILLGCVAAGFVALAAGCVTKAGPLAVLPMTSPGAAQWNLEGIKSYNDGDWHTARTRFELAIHTDPRLPEAHFNLALTLHKLGDHDQARTHFRIAGELAPDHTEIVRTSVYRNHLGLSSTFERHVSGGYKY